MIAVSIAWNALRHDSAAEIIAELRSLDFRSFELNVQMTEGMLQEIREMLPEIEVTTLHNYCPLPEGPRSGGSGDFYPFSSPDPGGRRKAVDSTMRTLQWAHRLGAKAVILHCGYLPMPHRHRDICKLRLAGRHEEADEILRADLAVRERVRGPYLEAALSTITELVGKTAGQVMLGIETRIGLDEIPSFGEMELFLQAVPVSAGGYWHDFGHAHLVELTGAARHGDFIDRFGGRMIGMHIHDVSGTQEHGPLTHGTIDFAACLTKAPAGVISVLEIHGHASPEQLVKSREVWESLLAEAAHRSSK